MRLVGEQDGQPLSEATLWRAIRRLGWTQTNRRWQRARRASATRLYGEAPQDQRATGPVPRNHGKNTTVVAALAPDGLHEPWMIEGAMDTATFEWYIREQLRPTLRAFAQRLQHATASCSSCRPTRPA